MENYQKQVERLKSNQNLHRKSEINISLGTGIFLMENKKKSCFFLMSY